jgi:uncharacterized protein (TIGR00290 family)
MSTDARAPVTLRATHGVDYGRRPPVSQRPRRGPVTAVDRVRGWMSWSSGKDSAFALHTVRSVGRVEITGLLTTVTAATDRVAVHGVRRVLLQAQADALGLPLHVVALPRPCPNDVYEQRMTEAMAAARRAGAKQLVFGDLFLGDVRSYREQSLEGTGITPLFPLWARPTAELAADMIAQGLRAVITCVDPAQAPAELAGRWYDEQLLRELPAGVDPCGERGEFHTFVVDGPGFHTSLHVVVGEITERDGFVFADLLPT